MTPVTYKIGKITITQQALAVFIISIVAAIVAFFILREKPAVATGAFIGALIGGTYATYVTNCTIVGECNALAWFLVAVNIVGVLLLPTRLKMLKNLK